MNRKNWKKSRFAYGALALALALLLTVGMLPAVSVQAATDVPLRVSYEIDGVSSIGKGMPFGATFYFSFPTDQAPPVGGGDVTLTMSSSGIVLSKKSFDFDAASTFLIDSDEDPHYVSGLYTYSF